MRLVDREEAEAGAFEQAAETRAARPLGRDIEQVQLARDQPVLRLAPVGVGGGEARRADAERPGLFDIGDADLGGNENAVGKLAKHEGASLRENWVATCIERFSVDWKAPQCGKCVFPQTSSGSGERAVSCSLACRAHICA